MTLQEILQNKANELVEAQLQAFDLATMFGLIGESRLRLTGYTTTERSRMVTIRMDLDDLTEELRVQLGDRLVKVAFDKLLKEHLAQEADVEVEMP